MMDEIRRQYFDLKRILETNEAKMEKLGIPIPPRPAVFYKLQQRFESTFEQDLLVENNDVPGNKRRIR
jgi:hypothetical protein